jgi:hypothetical protein
MRTPDKPEENDEERAKTAAPTNTDEAPAKPKKQKGPFAATGDYLWYAFSDGADQYKHIYDNLDMRHKVIVKFHYC